MSSRFRGSLVLAAALAVGCSDNAPPISGGDGGDNGGGGNDTPTVDFTETWGADTADVGNWILTTEPLRTRTIETTGGNPGGYLYGDVSISIPTWSTMSTRFQPGTSADPLKRDSVFVGDWYANDVQKLAADIEVIQSGNWAGPRAATLHLGRWDAATSAVAFDAFYTLADLPDVPDGWRTYAFPIDARSRTVPPGWVFLHGDGTPATDAEWPAFMQQIDAVDIGLWKPGDAYPSMGIWELGLDNVHISSVP